MNLIFVHAQGRTGSTFLWKCFREAIPQCTAWLEPLHPGLCDHAGKPAERRQHPALRHFGVSDHYTEYRNVSDEVWRRWRAAREWWLATPPSGGDDPSPLVEYVEALRTNSYGLCVLQVNRLHGRLPLLRRLWPGVPIIHQWRSLEAQWESAKEAQLNSDFFGEVHTWLQYRGCAAAEMDERSFDRYASVWAHCIEHGRQNATVSGRYENMLDEPVVYFRRMLSPVNLEQHAEACSRQVAQPKYR